ncbi:hypothetical protein FRUB_09725 [Fimbriiglobus ruber]|uniref:Uncharacterized protein n=1 Tax=Fimbriiglobus ruber TaxID=1908690 RepID=A0A225D1S9_9BACT|nr:hypothetical protein FRUB_09725 [Fimbriiglobus ruber]
MIFNDVLPPDSSLVGLATSATFDPASRTAAPGMPTATQPFQQFMFVHH